jgi:hypothetical protein
MIRRLVSRGRPDDADLGTIKRRIHKFRKNRPMIMAALAERDVPIYNINTNYNSLESKAASIINILKLYRINGNYAAR